MDWSSLIQYSSISASLKEASGWSPLQGVMNKDKVDVDVQTEA
jgi:hypothetical protein